MKVILYNLDYQRHNARLVTYIYIYIQLYALLELIIILKISSFWNKYLCKYFHYAGTHVARNSDNQKVKYPCGKEQR